jgi:predicted Ser/Thr protein kinase
MSKINFTSGELNRIFYDFKDDLNKLHEQGIIHSDLGHARNSAIRPNIIISTDKIRLIDFESIKLKEDTNNWTQLLEKEENEISNFFNEIIEFACETLT